MLLYLYKMQPEPNMFLCKTPALKVNSSNLKLYDFTGCIYVLETLRCNSELKQCRQNVSLTGKIWYVQHEFVNTKLILYHFNVTSIFDFKKNVFNVVKDFNFLFYFYHAQNASIPHLFFRSFQTTARSRIFLTTPPLQ